MAYLYAMATQQVRLVDGVKGFLTKQIGPFPVYVYMVGLLALVGGVWYFKTHSSGTTATTAAPQTNYPTNLPTDGINPIPLPYPLGQGTGGTYVAPAAPFQTPQSPGPAGIASFPPGFNQSGAFPSTSSRGGGR